jgi:hypothetical protein
MSEKYYGVLTTYNHHDGLWYAFDRTGSADFFSKPERTTYGKGNSAVKAIKDYLAKTSS